MKSLLLSATALCFIFLFSCKKENVQATYLNEDSANSIANVPETNQTELAKARASQMLLPNTAAPSNRNVQQVSPEMAAAASGVTVNPPHGQPGHRCDIAVGAPLNMGTNQPKTMKIQTTPVQPKVVTAAQTSTSQKTVTPPGMNPPHGEPGHRCDIAVGAPLNSKPNTAQTSKPFTITSGKPVTATATPAEKTATAPGMNPPHGEPGHRCDIAVGAPLDSAPQNTGTSE